ncbi:hypothetical protein CSKR_203977 [Clonorchis sinensis]|uniref:Uncharacterized protein n=1 Tax=Clonorchis sinensis TaxID=79923 RepID=A0A8T1MQ83_CLOSI|nr:hypothetical protein CSKR_203977 [Clonorchis sinensis]
MSSKKGETGRELSTNLQQPCEYYITNIQAFGIVCPFFSCWSLDACFHTKRSYISWDSSYLTGTAGGTTSNGTLPSFYQILFCAPFHIYRLDFVFMPVTVLFKINDNSSKLIS